VSASAGFAVSLLQSSCNSTFPGYHSHETVLSSLVAGSAVLAGAIAAATAAPPAARPNPLQVRMVAATGKASDFLGAVEVSVTNTSRHAVRVPTWELPRISSRPSSSS
jgi:hypothetical protein